jgi:serine/threonine protein kinase
MVVVMYCVCTHGQVCSAMVEMTRMGIAHGDLATRNLLVAGLPPSRAVEVKVCDFGLSVMRRDGLVRNTSFLMCRGWMGGLMDGWIVGWIGGLMDGGLD